MRVLDRGMTTDLSLSFIFFFQSVFTIHLLIPSPLPSPFNDDQPTYYVYKDKNNGKKTKQENEKFLPKKHIIFPFIVLRCVCAFMH